MGKLITNDSGSHVLDVETKEQKQFREDMTRAGIKVLVYSGRYMYGDYTWSVNCECEDEPSMHEVLRATSIRLRQDTMGTGIVLYV